MNRILFASDLTERSRRAGDRARLLQKPFDARLTAVHVLEEDLPEAMLRRRMEEAEESLRASLNAAAGADAEDAGNVDVEVVPGVDHDILVKKAGNHDLLVLGMHRARFVDAFVGTTADRVMRSTDRPVLMVKDDAVTGYGRVLIAVDLSPSSKRAAAAAAWLAPDAQFFLVNAHDVPFGGYMTRETRRSAAYDAEIDAAMDEIEVELPYPAERRLIRIGDPVPTIREACDEVGADLVVLATRNHAGLARIFMGSVAEQLLADPPCDVLVVRGRAPNPV